ncbi:hypothetical protein [truncated ORF], partial [Penicillium rubens Wisconsin 54-1255]
TQAITQQPVFPGSVNPRSFYTPRTAEDEDEAGDEDRELIQLSLRVLVVIPRPEDVDGDVEGAKNACVETLPYPVARVLCATPGQDLHLYAVFRISSLYGETKQVPLSSQTPVTTTNWHRSPQTPGLSYITVSVHKPIDQSPPCSTPETIAICYSSTAPAELEQYRTLDFMWGSQSTWGLHDQHWTDDGDLYPREDEPAR